MAEERKTKSEEEIKDLPKKEMPLTPDELGDVAGGVGVIGVGGIYKPPGEATNINFEASTDGKPPTPTG